MRIIFLTVVIILSMVSFSINSNAKKEFLVLTPAKTLTGSVNFDSVTVMDLRTKKDGNKQLTGAYFKTQVLTTEDSFDVALKKMALQIIEPATQKKKNELVILLHDLQFGQITGSLAISTIYLKMDAYLKNNEGYHLVINADSLYEFPSGNNIEQFGRFNKVLNYIFTANIIDAIKLPVDRKIYRSLDEVLAEDKTIRDNVPVFNNAPKKGIYYTVQQFLDNTPSDTNFIHERICYDGVCQSRFFLSKEPGGRKKGKNLGDTACFAIYDDERGKWYHPVSKYDAKQIQFENGNYYYLEIQKGLYVEDYSSLGMAGFQFGALGALAYSGTAAVLEDKQAKKPSKFKDALYKLRLDPDKGKGIRVDRLE